MIIIRKNQVNTISPDSETTIHEYEMAEKSVSGAVAEINGRYPKNGFAVNEISKEIVYVIKGNGAIATLDEKREFGTGDVIFIDKGEKFYWQGEIRMFMVTLPKFDPEQHKII